MLSARAAATRRAAQAEESLQAQLPGILARMRGAHGPAHGEAPWRRPYALAAADDAL